MIQSRNILARTVSARNILLALAASATLLSGCSTPSYVSPVEVTRFTGAAPEQLGRGTIRLEAAPGLDPQSLEYGLFEAQISEELATLGYRIAGQNAAQVAVIDIEQIASEPTRRNPVSVGGGANVGSYGSGVGLGIGIDLSGPPPGEIDTQLSVAIHAATGGSNLWEGRARFTATSNSEFADPALAADRAAAALFTDFPGNSGETIEVQ